MARAPHLDIYWGKPNEIGIGTESNNELY